MVSTHAWKAPTSPPPSFGNAMSGAAAAGGANNNNSSTLGGLSGSGTAGNTANFGSPSYYGFGGGSNSGYPSGINTGGIMAGGGSTFIAGGAPPPSIVNTIGASSSPSSAAGQVADFESLLASSSSLLSSFGHSSSSSAAGRTTSTTGGIMSGASSSLDKGSSATSFIGSAAHPSASSSSSAHPTTLSSSSAAALGNKSLLELSVASRSSSSVPMGGSSSGSAALSGNIHNINNSNNNMMSSASTTTYEAEASAHRLLARDGWGFDSAKLGRLARDLEMRTLSAANHVGAGSGAGAGGVAAINNTTSSSTHTNNYNNNTNTMGMTTPNNDELTTLGTLSGTSLQEILARHSNHVVHSALRSSRALTEEQAKERLERRLVSDWGKERNEILGRGVLGNRFLMGVGGSIGGGGIIGDGDDDDDDDGRMHRGMGVASRVPLLEGEAFSTSSPTLTIVPSPQAMPRNLDPLISSHLQAVTTTTTTTTSYTTASSSSTMDSLSNALALISTLQEGMESPSIVQSTLGENTSVGGVDVGESMNRYSNALSLVKSIINCSANLGVAIGDGNNNNVAVGIMGACNFFSNQFRNYVIEMVREAEFAGHGSGGGSGGGAGSAVNNTASAASLTPMARDVSAFAAIMAGREVVDGRGGVWPRLFYCLRSGDAVAANSILKQFGNIHGNSEDMSTIDPAVLDIISQLAQIQQQQETIFGDSTSGSASPHQQLQYSMLSPTQAMTQTRRVISDLYERTKTRVPSLSNAEPFLVYRAACLAMLSGSESISEATFLGSSGLVKTVEDYLYGSLWYALHLTDVSSSTGSGNKKMEEAVAHLGMLVNEWGPSYFEQDDEGDGAMYGSATDAVALAAQGGGIGGAPREIPRSGGWAYTLPLLASQQYATALAYLAEAGGGLGLLQATHIGLAMNIMGLPITDSNLGRNSMSNASQALFPMLAASFSASLQGSDTEAALQYIMVLPREGSIIKEQVQRLLLETRQFETLAGKIEPDGSRSKAALDVHFSKAEVSSLLADAASDAMRAGKAADAAELLVLSGRFGSLFSLMNRELASYLVVTTQEDFDKRQFWFHAAGQFHNFHLSPGKTYVQDALEKEGGMYLGNTFQLLMNIIVFFDRCREQQWEGAWVLMDNLELLPKNDSEMTVKVDAFRSLDTCVRQVFHHVVLAIMEALCHLYRSLKLGGAGLSIDQQNATDQSLNELRTRARLLVTFSRLINLPNSGDSDTYVRLSQLEKNMM